MIFDKYFDKFKQKCFSLRFSKAEKLIIGTNCLSINAKVIYNIADNTDSQKLTAKTW